MIGESKITRNQVIPMYADGGGRVYVLGGGVLELKDHGSISYNTAGSYLDYCSHGGGIMADTNDTDAGGVIDIDGGEIAHNISYKGAGGGIMANGTCCIYIYGTGTIHNNEAIHSEGGFGGGIALLNGRDVGFYIYVSKDSIITNNMANLGGGIYFDGAQNDFTSMSNIFGQVNDNKANYGGGIYLKDFDNLTIGEIMRPVRFSLSDDLANGPIISNNTAKEDGAGIYAKESKLQIAVGTLKNNIADRNGGGIYQESSEVLINCALFNKNNAVNGGGIYLDKTSILETEYHYTLPEGVRFLENKAANEGGAIYTEDFKDYKNLTNEDYRNIILEFNTAFSGNHSAELYTPPSDAAALFPNLKFVSTSGEDHILNNHDINYTDKIIPQYTVTYSANGGTGSVNDANSPYNALDTVTVLSNNFGTGISRNGYTFQHWNDKANDSGTKYVAGDTFKIEADTTLYAIWKENGGDNTGGGGGGGGTSSNYTVVYDGNGGIRPNNTDEYRLKISVGTKHTVLSNSSSNLQFERKGYTFLGWSTTSNGTEPDIKIGNEYNGKQDEVITIYALWEEQLLQLNREDHDWYITGYPDNTVRPERQLTRGEAASIFFRLTIASDKEVLYTANYPDINQSDWFYNPVAYLSHHGILVGYEDGTFRPDAPITRAELATLASKFDTLSLNMDNHFSDVSDSHWAVKYIASASQKGWITGYPDGTFKPNQNITRAETASLINRVLDRSIALADLPEDTKQYTDLNQGHWAYCDLMEASHSHLYERKEEGELDEVWISHSHN